MKTPRDNAANQKAAKIAESMACMLCGSINRWREGDYRATVEREELDTGEYTAFPVCVCHRCRAGQTDEQVMRFVAGLLGAAKEIKPENN